MNEAILVVCGREIDAFGLCLACKVGVNTHMVNNRIAITSTGGNIRRPLHCTHLNSKWVANNSS